jgi:secreted Zn-dependent insulinase-like peptidase
MMSQKGKGNFEKSMLLLCEQKCCTIYSEVTSDYSKNSVKCLLKDNGLYTSLFNKIILW